LFCKNFQKTRKNACFLLKKWQKSRFFVYFFKNAKNAKIASGCKYLFARNYRFFTDFGVVKKNDRKNGFKLIFFD